MSWKEPIELSSKKDNPPKEGHSLNSVLRVHSAFLIALFYFCLNTVGVSYNIGIFWSVGVNYADFANIDDFLLSSLKNPIVLIYTFILVAPCLIVFFQSKRFVHYFWAVGNRRPIVEIFLKSLTIFLALSFLSLAPYSFARWIVWSDLRNLESETENGNLGNAAVSIGSGLIGSRKVSITGTCKTDTGSELLEDVNGWILSEAGDFFLIVENRDVATLVRKTCVQLIDRAH